MYTAELPGIAHSCIHKKVATKHKADEELYSLCEADLQYQHIADDLAFCTCELIVQSVV